MKRLLGSVILALVGLLVSVPSALAGDTTCADLLEGTHDNVAVPDGKFCTLWRAHVKGNVKVLRGGGLLVMDDVTIDGNLEAEPGHTSVVIMPGAKPVVVKGNVQVKGGSTDSGFLAGTEVHGSIDWEGNGGLFVAQGAAINGNLKIEKHTGLGSVTGNTISGNLQCKDNSGTLEGAANTVSGNMEGQCKEF